MSRPRSPARRVFDSVERTVGEPLEEAANSETFIELMALSIRARRAAVSGVVGVVHGVTGSLLRAVNIPTRDDVRRLDEHMVALAGELKALERRQRMALAARRAERGAGAGESVDGGDASTDADG